MLKRYCGVLILLSGLLLLPAVYVAASPVDGQTQQLTILHTNDLHGRLLPFYWDLVPIPPEEQPVGGLARQATVIKQLRSEIQHPIALVDAGDLFAYGPWHIRYLGEPEVEALNLLGYDAMTAGNHDVEVWMNDQTLSQLLALVEKSHFPWLSANLIRTRDGQHFSQIPPYIIKDYNGFKVGFLGLTVVVGASNPPVPGITLNDVYAAAAYWVPIIRPQCDVLIAVTHLDIYDNISSQNNTTLIQRVPGIDAVVAGHSHQWTETPVWVTNPAGRQVPIVSAGYYGMYVGRLDLNFTYAGGSWQLSDGQEQLIPVTNAIPADAEMEQLLDRYVNAPANGPVADATYISQPPVIDGDLGEWSTLTAAEIGVPGTRYRTFRTWNGPTDCHASARLAWDENYLYFAADVTDNIFSQTRLPDALWRGDSIQIAFDPLFNRSPGYYEMDDRDYWFAYQVGKTIVYCRYGATPGERTDINAKAKRKPDASGWTLEVAFPWSELGVVPEDLNEMGFSWVVYDSDSGDYFAKLVEWTPGCEMPSWSDPNAFGQLMLQSLPTRTITLPIAGTYQFSLPILASAHPGKQFRLSEIISDPNVVVSRTDPQTGLPYQIETWSAPGQAFTYGTLNDLLNPGQAYIVEVSGPASLQLSGVSLTSTKDIRLGWNFIGGPAGLVKLSEILGKVRLTSGPWVKTSDGTTTLTTDLSPTVGYWAYNSLAGTLGYPVSTGTSTQNNSRPPTKPIWNKFYDVSPTHWAYAAVSEMRWLGITGGYGSDQYPSKIGKPATYYKPTYPVTRAQMAMFLTRAFNLTLPDGSVLRFSDVGLSNWANRYVEAVYQAGIMGAYTPGTNYFKPGNKVTRAQFAVMLARAAHLTLPNPVPQVYDDVLTTSPGAAEIAALQALGVFDGQPNLTTLFRPNAYLTRAEMALYLDNLLNITF